MIKRRVESAWNLATHARGFRLGRCADITFRYHFVSNQMKVASGSDQYTYPSDIPRIALFTGNV